MKKIFAILALLMLVPFTAFGLEALSENALDDVTGQAGVSINLDVNIDATFETIAWGDSDGLGGTTAGGLVGLRNVTMDNLHISPRTDWALSTADDIHKLEFLSIDVATDAKTYGMVTNPQTGETTDTVVERTFVRINPGTLEIKMDSFDAEVGMTDLRNGYQQLDEIMGLVNITDFNMKIAGVEERTNSGWGLTGSNSIDIYSGFQGQGVVIDVDLLIDSITIEDMSWGDSDGITAPDTFVDGADESRVAVYANGNAGTDAGYVGASNLNIDDLLIKGRVTIDVATVTVDDQAGLALAQVPGLFGIWIAGNPGGASSTYVHLGFDQMNIRMLQMTMDVTVGADNTLSDGTLGSMYVRNMDMTVDGWVDIHAH